MDGRPNLPPIADPACWTLPALLAARTAATPAALALTTPDGAAWDYATLDARGARTAGFLGALGIVRDEAVGVLLRNTPALIEAWLGLVRLGASHAALNPELTGDFLAHALALAGVRTLIVHAGTFPPSSRWPPKCRHSSVWSWRPADAMRIRADPEATSRCSTLQAAPRPSLPPPRRFRQATSRC